MIVVATADAWQRAADALPRVPVEEAEGSLWVAPDGRVLGTGSHTQDASRALRVAGVPSGADEFADHDAMKRLGFARIGLGDYGDGDEMFVEVRAEPLPEAQRAVLASLYRRYKHGAFTYAVGDCAQASLVRSGRRWTDFLRAVAPTRC